MLGVNTNCDVDYGYIDYPAIIKSEGLNGFGDEPTPDPHALKNCDACSGNGIN